VRVFLVPALRFVQPQSGGDFGPHQASIVQRCGN
jgi:hypothetical protein